MNNWYDKHITFEDSEYIVWDETGAYVVGTTAYKELAIIMCEWYAEYLDKNYGESN